MATRDTGGQKHATKRDDEVDEAAAPPVDDDVQARKEKLDDDVDAILDEIDDVLEEDAETFVRGYVQKGGQ